MSGNKPWDGVAARQRLAAARQVRAESRVRAGRIVRALPRTRQERGITQSAIARTLAVSQSRVSRLEQQHDIQLATLRDYIVALGGELQVRAIFPDGTVNLSAE